MHFELTGMTCLGCVQALTQSIDKLKGVTEADIRVNEMDLAFDDSLCNVGEIMAAVRRAGNFEIKGYSPIAQV